MLEDRKPCGRAPWRVGAPGTGWAAEAPVQVFPVLCSGARLLGRTSRKSSFLSPNIWLHSLCPVFPVSWSCPHGDPGGRTGGRRLLEQQCYCQCVLPSASSLGPRSPTCSSCPLQAAKRGFHPELGKKVFLFICLAFYSGKPRSLLPPISESVLGPCASPFFISPPHRCPLPP